MTLYDHNVGFYHFSVFSFCFLIISLLFKHQPFCLLLFLLFLLYGIRVQAGSVAILPCHHDAPCFELISLPVGCGRVWRSAMWWFTIVADPWTVLQLFIFLPTGCGCFVFCYLFSAPVGGKCLKWCSFFRSLEVVWFHTCLPWLPFPAAGIQTEDRWRKVPARQISTLWLKQRHCSTLVNTQLT